MPELAPCAELVAACGGTHVGHGSLTRGRALWRLSPGAPRAEVGRRVGSAGDSKRAD